MESQSLNMREITLGKMKSMSSRLRSTGYQNLTTRIIAMVALFSIIVAFSVIVAYRANESVNPEDFEYLWFKVEPDVIGTDVTGDAFIYDEEGQQLEHVMLLNDYGWQQSIETYAVRTYVRIYVSFWYLDDKLNDVIYLIGRSPVEASLVNVTVTIISDWEEPIF